ncbi:PADR1 domain protein, partial [Oesophagostomum dentatum]
KRKAAKAENNEGESSAKKPQNGDSTNGVEDENKKALKKQADIMWKMREDMKKNLSKYDMQNLLDANDQPTPSGESNILDHLVDCAVFGCCDPCPKCGGDLRFSNSLRTYECHGQLSEYTKCTYKNENPPRKKFVIPADYKKENAYLKRAKSQPKETVVGHAEKFKRFGCRGDIVHTEEENGKKVSVVVKNGAVVDPECEYAEVSHVYRNKKGKLFTAVLGYVDMQSNRNSYYKIQLLRHDSSKIFYLFRSWGRVGTTIGGNKTETFNDEHSAVASFERF